MLESLVATILNRFIGSYVENFDPKQLNVGIWSGDVTLRDLKLKKESLDALELPLDVRFGYLGELTLSIPWSNLKSKPVRVTINDVYLLASPISSDKYNSEDEMRREFELKMRRLAELELIGKSAPSLSAEDTAKNESFTESLVTKIVDNLQVTITNIHLRYEDIDMVFAEKPYAIGATLNELSAVSTDGNWEPSFISITSHLSYKLLTLSSLCCYWNTDSVSIYVDDDDEILCRFRESIVDELTPDVKHQFILRPVCGVGQVAMSKLGSTQEQPHIKAHLQFEEFAVDLDNHQYKDMLFSLSKMHWYNKTHRFRKFRPVETVAENPKKWFKFAAKCVIDEIHDRNYQWTWESMKQRRDDRNAYIALWKKSLALNNNEQLDSDDESELEELHKKLKYEDIKFFRALAKKQFRQEQLEQSTTDSTQAEPEQPAAKGWFSSWWGGEQEATENSLVMTEEQRKELYDAIEYDESKALQESIDIPKDRIEIDVSAMLNRGVFTIKNADEHRNLGEVVFENCQTQFLQRPDSFLLNFSLHEFKIEDESPNTLYRHIVSVKNLNLEEVDIDIPREPFFQVSFENNPLNEIADSEVHAKLRSMTVFYHVHFINDIIKFFTPPKAHLDTIGAIMNAAEATVEGWTAQTRMGIEAILEDHKTINLIMDLQAPLIILPLNPHEWNSPCAVVDAGHISILSDLVGKDRMREIKDMSPENYDKLDHTEVRKLMYDKFNLHLRDAQFLIGPDIKSTITALNMKGNENPFVMLERLNMQLGLELSILPKAFSLPKVKVTGNLPRLKIALNDYQYKIMMQLIDICIPNFDPEIEIHHDESFAFYGNDVSESIVSLKEDPLYQLRDRIQSMSEGELNQHIFEFEFDVEMVQLSLLKCDDGANMKSTKLVDIIGENLGLIFFKRTKDMKLKLFLTSLNVDDYIEKSNIDEFKRLITSNKFSLVDDAPVDKDLFSLDLTRTQRFVEHQGSLIEVFDQDINIDMASLKLCINRESLLRLLNFVLTTFTDPNPVETPADALRVNDSSDLEIAPQHINVAINLEGIIMILNDDSIKLATLKLSKAGIKVLVLPQNMKVDATIGALSLVDEINEGVDRTSIFRNLISIEGDNLAEFTYQTYDPLNNPNPFGSSFELKTGALVFNFVEEPIKKIVTFLGKFQKMKQYYDTAREAAFNQTAIDVDPRMKLNVLIQAPVIVFPKLIDPRHDVYDNITAHLGEIYLCNSFEGEENHIDAGIRSTKLTSLFNFSRLQHQSLQILDNLDLAFKIVYNESATGNQPTFKITGGLSPTTFGVTELQLQYMLQLSDVFARAFTIDEDANLENVAEAAINANEVFAPNANYKVSKDVFEKEQTQIGKAASTQVKMDVNFSADDLTLVLYDKTKDKTDIVDCGISKFSIKGVGASFVMNENTHFKSEVHVKCFTVEDIRKSKDNKFATLIPEIEGENYQFMASISTDGPVDDKSTTLQMTVDSPKVILAMDYLFALKSFSDAVLIKEASIPNSDALSTIVEVLEEEDEEEEAKTTVPSKFGYTINIVDASILLLADPGDISTEAVVFKVGQFLLSSQNVLSISSHEIGMFLAKMDTETRIRMLDDFSFSLALDSRGSTIDRLLTSIELSVEPLVMRISLKDIRLAMLIFNRAVEMAKKQGLIEEVSEEENPEEQEKNTAFAFTREFKRQLSRYAPSIVTSLSENAKSGRKRSKSIVERATSVLKAENMNADIAGSRLVLIGDIHELPVLDLTVKPFSVSVKDWSTDLNATTTLEGFANVFNYSRSAWEPLVEPCPVTIHVAKTNGSIPTLAVDVISRKLCEVTVSSQSIALLSQVFSSISSMDEASKPRGMVKPYKIYNETGVDVEVWVSNDKESSKQLICNGESLDWEFEDWRIVRENLDTNIDRGSLALKFVDDGYESIASIPVTKEGEEIYTLQPPQHGVHNRLVCEVKLGEDNVKSVYLRSTVTLENKTSVDIAFRVDLQNEYHIPAGSKLAVPIDETFNKKIQVKPLMQDAFKWSANKLNWRDLMKTSDTLRCNSASDDTIFYFQVDAQFVDEPLIKVYPHMNIVLSAPLEIENLLPYDLHYRLYDKSSGKDWKDTLKKGVSHPNHVVTLDNFLLMSIQPLGCGFGTSEFGIVNTPQDSEFSVENLLICEHEEGQTVNFSLHYHHDKNAKSKKITIYSPYVILNRTAKDIFVSEDKYNILRSLTHKEVDQTTAILHAHPKLFSFKNDRAGNRAYIKVGSDGQWSKPTTFDAIGQSFDLTIPVPNKQKETNISVHIREGEGKYKFSKVVTISPRFILKNNLNVDIELLEVNSAQVHQLSAHTSTPLYSLRSTIHKQLMIKFAGAESSWSSPINIKDVGSSYLRVLKKGRGHVLLKVEILIEYATLFIHIEDAYDRWPYSIRNFSDYEFIFYQRDPNLDDDGEPIQDDGKVYKPLFYRVPPKSVMPYAWDFPAAPIKKLVITSRQRKREVQLADIGNLRPMRLPASDDSGPGIIDINVVADGPTQALVLSNYDPEVSLYKLKTNTTSSVSVEDKFEVQADDSNTFTRLSVNFEGLGISLINRSLQELCYITFRGIELKYNESDLYQSVSWKLKWMQIDNQLYGGIYPIVLYPAIIPKNAKEMDNHPTFSGSVAKVKDDSHGVLYIKYATMLLQELAIEIDEDFLFALLDFSKIPGAAWNVESRDVLCEESVSLPEPEARTSDSDFYFEALHIQPTQLNLSFVRTERINVEDKTSSQTTIMFFLNVLTMAVGNINDAPIKLNSLFMDNVRVPLPVLTKAVQTHYGQAFFYQLHKVLGSADFLGNPVGLFNTISSGVMDIFYEPYQGYVMNDRPQELGIGIAKGGLSFMKKSVFGISDSVAKLTGSMAKGLSAATQDAQFQERRRMNQRRNKPKHALYGLSNGASSFVEGLTSGIAGIAMEPVRGANKEGAQGFLKGLGRGIIGLPTKTVVGLLDMTSSISEGIRNTTTVFDGEGLDKIRMPRHISHDQVIRPFNAREAQGQFLLKTVGGGELISDEYLAHIVLPGDEMVLIVTIQRIALISIAKMTVQWQIGYKDICAINLESSGIRIDVVGVQEGPFVPISDDKRKKSLYNHIAVAVREYNKKCQVVQ